MTIQPGQFIEAIRIFYNPELEVPAWQFFLFFQATNIVILANNAYLQRRIKWIHDVGCMFYFPYTRYSKSPVSQLLTIAYDISHCVSGILRGHRGNLPFPRRVVQLVRVCVD